jgi:hypothetical protein
MASRPTGWNRFVARLQGEVPAEELEAFRRASATVFELLDRMEHRRLECSIDGLDPWTVPPATRTAFLCAWNAFVLQTVGDQLLEADYRAEPRTPGYVPPTTAKEVLRFYRPVEGWVNRACQAEANPDYRLDVDVPAALPALVQADPFPPALPALVQADPFPPAHLGGLLHAIRAVLGHAGMAMEFLPATPPQDREKQVQLNRIRQLHASAQTRARYAEDLCGTDPVPEVRERAAEHAEAAIAQLYLLGQLVADPTLAREGPAREPPRTGPERPTPTIPRTEPNRIARVPAPERPPRPRAPEGPVAALSLVTRRDEAADQTITEPAVAVEFMGTLRHQAGFALRPALVRGRDGVAVVLRTEARSAYGPAGLMGSTITVYMDGRKVKLHPLPDKRSRVTAHGVHEESASFALPAGMLEEMGAARRLWLRIQTWRASLQVDTEDSLRLGVACRAFHEAIWTARE